MFNLPAKLKISLVSMLYGMMISSPVVADDTEIYTSTGATAVDSQANILFVLDTSGSMKNKVYSRPAYDPNTTYLGSDACFQTDRAYIQPKGLTRAARSCSNNRWDEKVNESNLPQARLSAIVCDAASSIATVGYYTGTVSQYRGDSWQDSITKDDIDKFVECEADNGVHGQTISNAKVWASSTNGPWSSSQSDSINWGNTGLSTTLYSGNYLNYIIASPLTFEGTRLTVMQEVITDLLASTRGVNVGLMRYSRNGEGGMVATPVDDIAKPTVDGTHANTLINAVDAMTADGATPLAESFYEAAMYFQGKSVDYGNSSTPFHSVAESRTGNAYISPIADECQKNYVILLTDGEPNRDDLNSTRRGRLNIGSCDGNCLDEIAKSVGTNDQSTSIQGDQFLSTFTIGFTIDNQLLLDTAKESFLATGTGERYLADNTASLAETLNNIFADIYTVDTTFSSPAVSVNAFNRSTHIEDLYFTLFRPAIGNHWPGNFKKYKLDFYTDTDDTFDYDGDTTERIPFIADVAGDDAVAATGFFDDNARSYWSTGIDGFNVTDGGAAHQLPASRNVYTYTGNYTDNSGVFTPPNASAALTSTANIVDKTNLVIDESLLDIAGDADKLPGIDRRDTVLDWAKGLDVFDIYGVSGTTTDARPEMGDPLHSGPALVQYGEIADPDSDNSEKIPDLVAYVATNDGYLHAFNTLTGVEIFSFIPQELLENLNDVMDNKSSDKTYGLDGDVVAWVNDINKDGEISGTGEHVYLYIGMRRGGKNIYSLDVTNRDRPVLRWVIKGGNGDYAELGQTWSSINVEKIKDGNTEKTVLMFGGGYDEDQDDVDVRTDDSVGRAVYIADAESGALLWSAGPGGTTTLADMKYSIPARVKPLDIKGDGFIDRLYVADMGGQIFRFDIDNTNSSPLAGSIKGGRIANLSVDASKADARRFYYPPDVALIAERGKKAYLALSIASGYRAHPNDTEVHDRIYLLKDNDVYRAPSTYATLTEADLYDATLNLVAGDGDATQNNDARDALDTKDGWFILLEDETSAGNWLGEKGLAETLILNGVVIVTTFTPASKTVGTTNNCSPNSGLGQVYFMNVLDAAPIKAADTDKRSDRHLYKVQKGGIPPTPTTVVTEKPTLCIGTQCNQADFLDPLRGTYWFEVEK